MAGAMAGVRRESGRVGGNPGAGWGQPRGGLGATQGRVVVNSCLSESLCEGSNPSTGRHEKERRVCGGELGGVDRRLSILVLWGRIAVCNNEPQSFSLELV
jgi:hypothetical protein